MAKSGVQSREVEVGVGVGVIGVEMGRLLRSGRLVVTSSLSDGTLLFRVLLSIGTSTNGRAEPHCRRRQKGDGGKAGSVGSGDFRGDVSWSAMTARGS